MELELDETIEETSVTINDITVYPPDTRGNHAAIMYVNAKKTTGDSPFPVTTPDPNPLTVNKWIMENVVDSYYKAELLMIPTFATIEMGASEQAEDIFAGTLIYYNGIFYRAATQIPNEIFTVPNYSPEEDYNNWEVLNTTNINDVYDEAFMDTLPTYAQPFYGSLNFVFYNNLMFAFLNLSATITKSCNICNNPQIEELRCLRDKYESVELATAAENYSGAQTIIESSENLVNSCSC